MLRIQRGLPKIALESFVLHTVLSSTSYLIPRQIPSRRNFNTRKTTGFYDLTTCHISRLDRPTLMTLMNPDTQIFRYPSSTVRANLRRAIGVNFAIVDTTLEANPRQYLIHKLSQPSIKSMFTQHTFCHDAEIQVFHENHQ